METVLTTSFELQSDLLMQSEVIFNKHQLYWAKYSWILMLFDIVECLENVFQIFLI